MVDLDSSVRCFVFPSGLPQRDPTGTSYLHPYARNIASFSQANGLNTAQRT